MPPPSPNKISYHIVLQSGQAWGLQTDFIFKIQWMLFFFSFKSTGNVNMVAIQMLFQALYTLNSPKQIKNKKQKSIIQFIQMTDVHLHHPPKNINSIVSTI